MVGLFANKPKGPLSDPERGDLGRFCGGILRGTAQLGLAALPLVTLYQRAQAEKLTIIDLALEDQETVRVVLESLRRQAAKLPLPILQLMEQVVVQARQRASGPIAPEQAMTLHDRP